MRNPAPPENKKSTQSPMVRIEAAIAHNRQSAFDRALEDLFNSNDTYGNWQHRVLGLLIDLRFSDEEGRNRQVKWVKALLGGPVPPKPTENEKFMSIACKKHAHHLMPLLQKAGFSMPPTAELQAVLDLRHPGTDARQLDWLRRLLASDNPPLAKDNRHTIEQVIRRSDFHLLPDLHAAGFDIQAAPDYEGKVAAALGCGRWSYPDLIMPKLFESPRARNAFCDSLSVSLVQIPSGTGGFLQIEHIEKFCTLHLPKRISMRSDIHSAIYLFGSRNQPIHPSDETTQALLRLQEASLIDIGKVARGNSHHPNILNLIAPAIAQLEFSCINEATVQPVHQARSRRI